MELFGVATVLVLVLVNAFFVASEFSMVAVRRSRLEQLDAAGNASARVARRLIGRVDKYIAATQLGITMASLGLGWVGEPSLAHLIEPPMEALIGQVAPAVAHGVAIGISFAIITGLHIILGEQVPKLLGMQRAEPTALFVARPMSVLLALLSLPTAVLSGVAGGVLRTLGLKPAGHEMVHSVEELRLLVAGSQQAGEVEESEARIATRAFEFADLTAGELMTPRTELDAVPLGIAFDTLLDLVTSSTHNRLPVYDGSLDNIVGVLYVHDLFAVLRHPAVSFDLRAIMRPVRATDAVPATKRADDLLDEMRAARRQFTVVIDEYGGTAGIVTLEDLVEALVGRIDEELPTSGTAVPIEPVPEVDGSLVLDGLIRLGEFEELTGIPLADVDYDAADTVGGLVMARLGRIPEPGDEVQVAGRVLRVVALDGRRVAAVRLLA